MQNQEKETYKDYLVRKVTEEIGKVFEEKMVHFICVSREEVFY